MRAENPSAGKLGPVQLVPGVTTINGWAFLLTMFFVGVLAPFINFAQPYILTEHLRIPINEQGAVSGDLAFWSEVVMILLAGVMGAWSDTMGRRLVFVFGLAGVALSYVLYPLATSYEELLSYRLIYAVGMAAIGAMTIAIMAEYPVNQSRGKLSASVGVLSTLGVMFVVAVLAPLPARFVVGGATAVEAGRYTYWLTAGIALAGVLIAWLGLSKLKTARNTALSLMQRLRIGLTAGRNPRIALSYGAAFIGRTDLVVVVIFLSLWITHVALEQGMSTEEALIEAGIMLGLMQGAGILFMPIMGFLVDRINRVVAVALATGLALVGYLWLGLLDQPMGVQAYPAAIILGMGQASAILTAMALVGQEVSETETGAVSGLFTLFGAIGILLATKIGGLLFDAWMPGAPFVITGLANGVILIAALVMVGMGLHRGVHSDA
ncbi:MAG TPA: MFS transporter [Gammaproteobacteria bacterium]|nr:MFS transporter [Gammaproteobacteria bacterium]